MSLFAHFPLVSYQPRTPLGKSINEYTAHLGKLNRSVFAFMSGSRGGNRAGKSQGCVLKKSCFLTAWTHPPWQTTWLYTRYRVGDIPIQGPWASLHPYLLRVRGCARGMRPLTCHLSHHFAYIKCHSLTYIRLSCCWVGKGGGYALQSLIMTTYL